MASGCVVTAPVIGRGRTCIACQGSIAQVVPAHRRRGGKSNIDSFLLLEFFRRFGNHDCVACRWDPGRPELKSKRFKPNSSAYVGLIESSHQSHFQRKIMIDTFVCRLPREIKLLLQVAICL